MWIIFAYYLLGGSTKPFAWMVPCIEVGGTVFLTLIVGLAGIAVLAPDPYSERAKEVLKTFLDTFVKLIKGLLGGKW